MIYDIWISNYGHIQVDQDVLWNNPYIQARYGSLNLHPNTYQLSIPCAR